MKPRSIWLLALIPAVAILSAAAAEAADRNKSRYRASPDPAYEYDRSTGKRIYSRPDRNGWYPHDSNQLKVGSRIWWEQMEREGRTGRPDWQ